MFSILFLSLLVLFIAVLILIFYLVNFFLSLKLDLTEKLISFERGFERIGKIHSSFRIHFFIVILMFVIFDLEVVILMGLLMRNFTFFIGFVVVLFFVFGGFYIEWYFGKLAWLV